jgi:hypothetical protein
MGPLHDPVPPLTAPYDCDFIINPVLEEVGVVGAAEGDGVCAAVGELVSDTEGDEVGSALGSLIGDAE